MRAGCQGTDSAVSGAGDWPAQAFAQPGGMGARQAHPGHGRIGAVALGALTLEPADPLSESGGDVLVCLGLVAGGHVRHGVLSGA